MGRLPTIGLIFGRDTVSALILFPEKSGNNWIAAMQLNQAECHSLRIRNHIVIIETAAENGMSPDLSVAHLEISNNRIIAQSTFSRTALNGCHSLAAQALVSKKRGNNFIAVTVRQNSSQRHAVLDRLIGTLSKMRKHWVRRIPE